MSTSPSLPQATGRSVPRPVPVETFSVTVLIQASDGQSSARAANLQVPPVRAATVRDALSQIVLACKQLIRESRAAGAEIPWIDPPLAPNESESRFMVPIHD